MLMSKTLPQQGDAEPNETPETIRAHAFIAVGKFCIRDKEFSKGCLNILARELHQNLSKPSAATYSNALLVLGDLCVVYTHLVDRYLPVMAACLQAGIKEQSDTEFLAESRSNDASIVRKHAVLMLSSLLLQDYIKWRGLLFHRFLVASADENEGVATLAELTLTGPLLSRFPKLFVNNFVESVFVLNKCTAHPLYMAAAASGDNGASISVSFEGIDLSGSSGRARRHQMYHTMLSNMSDEEKISVTARIAKAILGAAVQMEGDLGRVCREPLQRRSADATPRDRAAFNVLSDAFEILTCPTLRVGRGANADESIDDPNSSRAASQQVVVAKGRLLSRISRKHLIEIVLPVICQLKVILQASCSPLLKELMRYLAEVFRAYNTEVKEFLANDPTLLQEVEYDAKQFTKANRRELAVF